MAHIVMRTKVANKRTPYSVRYVRAALDPALWPLVLEKSDLREPQKIPLLMSPDETRVNLDRAAGL